MFLNPSEEGAVASSFELVDKQWIMEKFTEMKEQMTRDLSEKIIQEMRKYFAELNDKSNAEDKNSSAQNKLMNESKTNDKILHVGVFCDHCDCQIAGIRYKCGDCEDFDLCEVCEELSNIHNDRHVFLKIRNPLAICPEVKKIKMSQKHIIKDSNDFSDSVLENPLKQTPLDVHSLDVNAEFVCDESVPNGTFFPPGENFVKKWRVRNTGHFKWDSYTTVRMRHSHPYFQPLHTEVVVPQLDPFQEGIISVTFRAPKTMGYFKSFWAFYYNDFLFGDDLWCKIIVANQPPDVPWPFDNNASARAMLKNWKHEYSQCRNKHKSKEKHKKKDHGKRKAKPLLFDALALSHTDLCPHKHVTSHTATPNNTPLYLTPPKSPEPKELTEVKKDNISDHVDNNMPEIKFTSNIQTLELDEKISFGNLSSSESDNEFVIIPMPKCFDLSEPYKTEHSATTKESSKDVTSAADSEMSTSLNIVQKESDGSRKTSISDNECDLLTELSKVIKDKSASRNEFDGAKPSIVGEFKTVRKLSISKNVSQETGVPEHAENFFLCCESPIFEDKNSQKNAASHMVTSPSSTSVSIIDSSGNNSPTIEPLKPIPADGNQSNVGKPEIVKPIIEISEAAVVETISGTFPKFPVEGIDAENGPLYNPTSLSQDEIDQLISLGNRKTIPASDYSSSNIPESSQSASSKAMQLLREMGFGNTDKSEQLLRKYKNDIVRVIEELIDMNDSDLS